MTEVPTPAEMNDARIAHVPRAVLLCTASVDDDYFHDHITDSIVRLVDEGAASCVTRFLNRLSRGKRDLGI